MFLDFFLLYLVILSCLFDALCRKHSIGSVFILTVGIEKCPLFLPRFISVLVDNDVMEALTVSCIRNKLVYFIWLSIPIKVFHFLD